MRHAPSLHDILDRQLVRTMLVPSIVCVLCIGAFISYRQYVDLKQSNKLLAQALGSYVSTYMQDAGNALRKLGDDVHQHTLRDAKHSMHDMIGIFPRFQRLLMIDPERNILAAFPSGLAGGQFPLLFPRGPDDKRLLVSHPLISPESGKLIIYMGYTNTDNSGVVAELSMEILMRHLSMFAASDGKHTLILTDSYGNVIAHPDETMVRTQANIGDRAVIRHARNGDYAFAMHREADTYYYETLVRVPGQDWLMILATPIASLYTPIAQTVLGLIALLVLFFIIVRALLARAIDKHVTHPLAGFATAICHAARGEYGQYTLSDAAESFSELAEIEKEFITMSGEIARREYDLLASRRLTRGIIDSLPSSLVGVNPDGRVIFWNTGAALMTGTNAAEAHGRPALELLPQLAQEAATIEKCLGAHSPATIAKMPWRQDEHTRYMDVSVYPLRGTAGSVIRMDDVSARVRLEEMMIQSEKMLSVGGLAAGMAHEINNPLGGVLQGAQNILRRVDDSLKANAAVAEDIGVPLDKVREYLERRGIMRMIEGIRQSGVRAAEIVSNMLNFTRRTGSRLQECDLHELIDTVVALAANDYDLKKHYDFKHVEIVRDFDTALPPVPCSVTEIEQVLFNLLKNAAHAMAEMDPPPSPPRIIISTRLDGDQAVVKIADNGPGVPEELRSRIFEPFFTTKEVGTGTGLGLSVSYFIVTTNHGGTFSLAPSTGPGSTFTFRLPLTAPEHDGAQG